MSDFIRAVEASRVKPGTMVTIDLGGKEVLVANIDGDFYAMGAVCMHEQWDLSEGSLKGFNVTCAGHGSVWDLRTGKAEFDEPLDEEPLYEVKVEGGFVMLRKR